MKIVHQSSGTSFRHAHCQHCRHEILLAPRVGWVELYPGTTYNCCPDNEHGVHQPDPGTDSERPYWMSERSTAT